MRAFDLIGESLSSAEARKVNESNLLSALIEILGGPDSSFDISVFDVQQGSSRTFRVFFSFNDHYVDLTELRNNKWNYEFGGDFKSRESGKNINNLFLAKVIADKVRSEGVQ